MLELLGPTGRQAQNILLACTGTVLNARVVKASFSRSATSGGSLTDSCTICTREHKKRKGDTSAQRVQMSRQRVTDAVKPSLQLIGVDTKHFSGLSMRRKGTSAAVTANVQAPVLYLQSGHGSKNAVSSYVVPKDPTVWSHTRTSPPSGCEGGLLETVRRGGRAGEGRKVWKEEAGRRIFRRRDGSGTGRPGEYGSQAPRPGKGGRDLDSAGSGHVT